MLKLKEKINGCILKHKETSSLKMAFFDSIDFVPASWNEFVGTSSLYLTTGYLGSIEKNMKDEMGFRYILFFKEDKPLAVAAFQIITVDSKSLDFEQTNKTKKLAGKVLDHVQLNCLINGTVFSSGEHGFFYSPELTDKEAFQALAEGTKRLCALEQTREKVHVMMVKEYFPDRITSSKHLKKFKYRDFKMEPNMVLDLKVEWNNMDDYFSSMTSKYRKKAKANLKKSVPLNVKDLNITEIKKYQPEIKALFHAVHDKAKQKLGNLDVFSFVDLKRQLKSKFVLKGYFLEEQLIGFSSIFLNNNELDANYVGLNYEYNKSYGLYLRMLYDFVELGIGKKLSKVHFGRTAGEIKSNLGAKAVDMECYVRTKNSVSNKIIKPLVKCLTTHNTFEIVERNPFKA